MNTGVREHVVQIRKANPCMTLKAIGEKVGVSRERIRVILSDENLPTKHLTKKLSYNRQTHKRHCLHCGTILPYPHKLYCNIECGIQYRRIPIVCTNCGEIFYREVSKVIEYPTHVNNPLRKGKPKIGYFCSKKCQGHWLVNHRKKRKTFKRKCDWDKVLELHNQGMRNRDISKELGIDAVQVCAIWHKMNKRASDTTTISLQPDVPSNAVVPPIG